ncbi:MAG TPA: HAD hydrolase-like protein [Gemmatimonadales bacterium]|jgi:predicted HAD superfamily phosphohydrolase YqeG|nr:HAD hydrolase-like protein [Gemmatimonadales bacterium]
MAAPSDWITTTRQALPRFFKLVSKLKPTFHLPDITAVDQGFVEAHRVAALLWDVDGTLMPHHEMGVATEFQATLKNLEARIPQAILSNCGETRFSELGRIFPELPVLKAYKAPNGRVVLRVLERGVERWSESAGKERVAVEKPSGPLTPLKKPSAELIEFALDQLGAPPRERTFMVGDQYFTDIAGANLAGIGSIKVPTFKPESFPLPVRSFQLFERAVYRLLHPR